MRKKCGEDWVTRCKISFFFFFLISVCQFVNICHDESKYGYVIPSVKVKHDEDSLYLKSVRHRNAPDTEGLLWGHIWYKSAKPNRPTKQKQPLEWMKEWRQTGKLGGLQWEHSAWVSNSDRWISCKNNMTTKNIQISCATIKSCTVVYHMIDCDI